LFEGAARAEEATRAAAEATRLARPERRAILQRVTIEERAEDGLGGI
jgi:hypothetical protein